MQSAGVRGRHRATAAFNQLALTRRQVVGGAAALGLLPAAMRAENDGNDALTYPRTITHAQGVTTIPSRPRRVVATSDFVDLDYLLNLNVEPVLYGFSNAWESGAMPWQTAAAQLPSFDAAGDPDLEAIAMARPDLILTMPISLDNGYELLSAIAPTIVLDWAILWRDGLRVVGQAMGLEDRAEALIVETDALLATTSETLTPVAGKRLMVGFQYSDAFYVWGVDGGGPDFFRDLGLTFVGGPDPILTEASLEQADLLQDADILLSVESDPAGIALQEASPLFQGLPAVKNGGYGVLSVVESRAISDGLSPLSIDWVLPQFVARIQELAAGEGRKL